MIRFTTIQQVSRLFVESNLDLNTEDLDILEDLWIDYWKMLRVHKCEVRFFPFIELFLMVIYKVCESRLERR